MNPTRNKGKGESVMRSLRVKWLIGAASAAAFLGGTVPSAWAQDPPSSTESARDEKKQEKAERKEEKREEKAEKKEEEKQVEPIFRLGLDAVVGRGYTSTVDGAVQPAAAPGQGNTNPTTIDSGRVTSYSFLLDGGMKLSEGFGIGMRLPLVGGTLFTDPTRSDGGVGSFEVSGAGKVKLADMVALHLSLAVSTPTAQGRQIPATGGQVPIVQGAIDQSNYDRFAVQRAASQARGYEDDELFQPQHLGINPKLALVFGTEGKWHVDAWVKFNDLIAVNNSYSYIGELVYGLNVGGFLIPQIEPVLRIWANSPLTSAPSAASYAPYAQISSTVAVVEPQIRFHAGPIHPYVGAILPIAGPLTNSPYSFGIRAGVSAIF